jgi:dienelactone hydrolase
VVQELRTAKVPLQLEIYSGTAHGFSSPKNKAEERAQRAVDRLYRANAQGGFRHRAGGNALTDSLTGYCSRSSCSIPAEP